MSNKSDFRLSLGQIMVRLAPLLLLGLVAFGEAASGARGHRPYEVGSKAIIYDTRAKHVVLEDERVRILTSTLENGGGLVAMDCVRSDPDALGCLPLGHFAGNSDGTERRLPANLHCDTQLIVADAWEGLSAFCFERTTPPARKDFVARAIRRVAAVITGGPEVVGRLRAGSVAALLPSTRQTCPESECLDVAHGGVAVDDAGDITLTEPHADRITTFRLGLRPPGRVREAEVIGKVQYSGRAGMLLHDVARVPGGGLVVAESSSTDPKLSSVRLFLNGEPKGEALVSGVYAGHPVGLWFSRDTQRLYITDVSDGVQRWMYVERTNGQWSTPRTFWAAADSSSETPLLRHVITGWNAAAAGDESREIVFAGGSDGLYVIDPAGLLLAKYVLGRSLSGLDWGRSGELFFASGRFIGVLHVAENVHPIKGYTPGGPPMPSQNPVQNDLAPSPPQAVDTPALVTTPPIVKPPPPGAAGANPVQTDQLPSPPRRVDAPTPVTAPPTVNPPPPGTAGEKPRPKKPRPRLPVNPACICR
jgi:hypothetical protein